MNRSLKSQLGIIVGICLVGLATGVLALFLVRNNVASMDLNTFSTLIFAIPWLIILVCSFAAMAAVRVIGRQTYLCMVSIALALGIVSMVVTSTWMSDPEVAAALLANSEDVDMVVPVLRQPVIILRDIAGYFVMATVGCIAGAWVGSRLHPLASDGTGNKKKKRKR